MAYQRHSNNSIYDRNPNKILQSRLYMLALTDYAWELRNNAFLNRACTRASHNALFWKSQTQSVNARQMNFDWIFQEILVKNCIVEMFINLPYLILEILVVSKLMNYPIHLELWWAPYVILITLLAHSWEI